MAHHIFHTDETRICLIGIVQQALTLIRSYAMTVVMRFGRKPISAQLTKQEESTHLQLDASDRPRMHVQLFFISSNASDRDF